MRQTTREIVRKANRVLWKRGLRAAEKRIPLEMTRLEERATPDISGTIFRDNNFDGQFLTANDQGFYAGVTVTAFDSLGNSNSATTVTGGTYTIPTVGLTGPFRIEVTVPPNFAPGPIGKDNPSTVRYLSDPNATGVTFGVVNPNNYSGPAPDLFRPASVTATRRPRARMASRLSSASLTRITVFPSRRTPASTAKNTRNSPSRRRWRRSTRSVRCTASSGSSRRTRFTPGRSSGGTWALVRTVRGRSMP